MTMYLLVGVIEKSYVKWVISETTHSKNEMKIYLDLSSYATKSDLKNATGFHSSQFAKEADLASLKSEIAKSDIGKLYSYS